MLGALSECTRDVDPEVWRRYFGIVVDGLRTQRDEHCSLRCGALTPAQTQDAMRAWKHPAR